MNDGRFMRYWYADTGENLIWGHGRAIRQVVPDTYMLQRLFAVTKEAARPPHLPENTFIAAMIAPLAVQEFGGMESPTSTPFSSAGKLLRLFDDLDIEQVAVNLFNGRTASAYAQGDMGGVADRIARGFADGDLLFLPRDGGRLYTQEILNALPGAVMFLLSRSQAERESFAGYLRRGTPPTLSAGTLKKIAKSRSALRTWEHEIRLLKGETA